MDVKPGYKQTEVGVIPVEWEIAPLGNHATFRTGPFGSALHKSDYTSDGIPVINPMHIVDGQIAPSRTMTITERAANSLADFRINPGEIVIGRRGDMGRCAVVQKHHGGWLCGTGSMIIRPQNADPDFLQRVLSSPRAISAIENSSVGTTMVNLNQGTLASLRVQFPPLPEQRAIAAALSDVDALLDGLDRLIAKKRDLKQAAMQQLLTGQTRLPGFHGEWEVKRLGEVGEISSAGVDKKIRRDEPAVRLVNYLDVYHRDFIYSQDLDHWVTAPTHQIRRCAVRQGDVFFTPTSETRNDIGLCAVAMEDIPDAAYSYHVARLRLHEHWDLRFRTYAFKTRAFLNQAETLCDGNGTRYVISQGKFRDMTISIPPLAEQTAIAAVLSDMDAELAALEARRAKTCDLKQAMMQELLTGRTRLV